MGRMSEFRGTGKLNPSPAEPMLPPGSAKTLMQIESAMETGTEKWAYIS